MKKIYINLSLFLSLIIPTLLKAQKGIEFSDTSKVTRLPSFIRFKSDSLPSLDDIQKFYKKFLPVNSSDELRLLNIKTDASGYTHTCHQQYYKGIRVVDGIYVIHSKNGKIETMNGNYQPIGNIPTIPSLSESQALDRALKNINATIYKWQIPEEERLFKMQAGNKDTSYYPKGELVIIKGNLSNRGGFRLSYKFTIYAHFPLSKYTVYVDAITGEILEKENQILTINSPGMADTRYSGTRAIVTDSYANGFRLRETRGGNNVSIQTFNMLGDGNYGAAVDYSDNDNNWTAAEYNNANKDNASLDAHWGTERVFDYFSQIRNRNSWNDAGGSLIGYAHTDLTKLGKGFANSDNAFWDGAKMTYGMGTIYDALTSLDIVAHEIGHGIAQSSIVDGIGTAGEAGSLNEALSDIWAASVKQWATPEKPIWLLASDVVNGGLRSMSDPKALLQPNTYGGAFWMTTNGCTPTSQNDNCFVHNNNGVLNYWFYLVAQGGAGTNDLGNAYNIAGLGINTASAIVYQAETHNYLIHNTDYAGARLAMIAASTALYGANSCQTLTVTEAWYAVGIGGRAFSISGPGSVCTTSGPFTIPNLPTGATVIWSVSPLNIVNIDSPNATQTTLTNNNNSGNFTLIASITNACGIQSVITSPTISVGAKTPISISGFAIDGVSFYGNTPYTFSSTGTQWVVNHGTITSGQGTNTISVTTNAGRTNGTNLSFQVSVRESDACGTSSYLTRNGWILPGSGPTPPRIAISPNPANNSIFISSENGQGDVTSDATTAVSIDNKNVNRVSSPEERQSNGASIQTSKALSIKKVIIYDIAGKALKTIQFDGASNRIQIDVNDLLSGTYFINIFQGETSQMKKIIVFHD